MRGNSVYNSIEEDEREGFTTRYCCARYMAGAHGAELSLVRRDYAFDVPTNVRCPSRHVPRGNSSVCNCRLALCGDLCGAAGKGRRLTWRWSARGHHAGGVPGGVGTGDWRDLRILQLDLHSGAA